MEPIERMRRDRREEGLSIRALARRHGVHRRAVRHALVSRVPPPQGSGGVVAQSGSVVNQPACVMVTHAPVRMEA